MNIAINEIRTPHGLLAAEVKTTIHCDWLTYSYHAAKGQVGLEGIVKASYGKPIEMESNNDTSYSHEIRKEPISDYDQKALEEIIDKGCFEDWRLRLVMVDLCNKGVIPEGEYVVTVSW